MDIRKPVVAGHFYPGQKKELEKTISTLSAGSSAIKSLPAKGAILPHAGYPYSGFVAAQTVSACEFKDTLVILGPNHTGMGESFGVMTQGSWQTPLGQVPIDTALAETIVAHSRYLKADTLAHQAEHSIEVILPFLQFFKKNFCFVPIAVSQKEPAVYTQVAEDILEAIRNTKKSDNISLIASSDMTHYESHESAGKKDSYAIEAILKLDADELLRRVVTQKITMCGVAPAFILIKILKRLGATQAQLIKYQTSGDTSGDFQSVVGYAGIRIS